LCLDLLEASRCFHVDLYGVVIFFGSNDFYPSHTFSWLYWQNYDMQFSALLSYFNYSVYIGLLPSNSVLWSFLIVCGSETQYQGFVIFACLHAWFGSCTLVFPVKVNRHKHCLNFLSFLLCGRSSGINYGRAWAPWVQGWNIAGFQDQH
jgi:hypothetical protein